MTIFRSRSLLVLAVGGLMLLALGPALALAADKNSSIVEDNGLYAFQPANIEVNVGQTVRWTNNSDAPHTVTADDSSFDSGTFNENEYVERTFMEAGEVEYHCELHSYMTGTVTVVDAGQTPPETDAAPTTAGTTGSGSSLLSLMAAGAAALVLGGWVLARRHREGRQGTAP